MVKRVTNYVVSHLFLKEELLFILEKIQQKALIREFGILSKTGNIDYEELIRSWNDSYTRPHFKSIMKMTYRGE